MTIDATRLAAARLLAGDAQPFLALALWAMTPVEQPGIGTFAIDERWNLYVDPDALQRWTVRESAGVLLHEAGHVVRDHAERARLMGVDQRTRVAWNIASDAEINDDLRTDAIELPRHGVFPELLRLPRGKAAEFYFTELLRRVDLEDVPDCGSGCHGVEDEHDPEQTGTRPPGLGAAEVMLLRKRIAEEVLRMRTGVQAGDVSGGWERWAEALLRPHVDWKTLLAARLRAALGAVRGASDFTYRKPARRRVPGVVLPALEQPLPAVAVVVDTSLSMRPAQLDAAWTEVHGALRALGVRRDLLRVYAGDVAMSRIDAPTARTVALTGGGGTDMRVGIALALRARPRPGLIVVLTDGYTPWPVKAPQARLVVVLLGADHDDRVPPTPPWATVVRVQLDDDLAVP
jgi:predicted metal-dependent peptidase